MSSELPPGTYRPAAAGSQPSSRPGGTWGVLHVVGGNDRGKQYQLQLSMTSIGRGADQDLILADIAVSRRHVQILIDGQRYRLKDLGSGNGTLINGVRSDSVLLNDGDQIEIGNTVMRLEHAPSRAQAAAPLQAPSLQASSENKTMMADAVNFPMPPPPSAQSLGAPFTPAAQSAVPLPPPPGPSGTMAMDAPNVAQPNMMRPSTPSLPVALNTGSHDAPGGGLLDSPAKKIAVFGTLGLIVLLGGAVVIKKFVMGGGDAQKNFVEAKKAYDDGDYVTAKRLFSSALALDPELVQAQKYIKQCDVEGHAKTALTRAHGLHASKRYVDEIKILDTIDKSSQAYKEVDTLKKEAVPAAVEALLAEAKDVIKDAPEDAQAKIDAALELDPENEEAATLSAQVKKGGGAVASADDKGKKGKKDFQLVGDDTPMPAQPTHKPVAVASAPRPSKHAPVNDDDDMASVKDIKKADRAPAPVAATPSAGGGDLFSTPAAGPYKNKDFTGAAAALRNVKNPTAQALANQVSSLQAAYFKAEGDKAKNFSAAVNEYTLCLGIDAKIAKGFHGPYFKSQLGKMEKGLAQAAFQQGKYDQAYEATKACARFGSDDGGVSGQLKTKAATLASQGEAMKKANPTVAKNMCRTVVTMVPPSDPSYAKCSATLKVAGGGSHDEDE